MIAARLRKLHEEIADIASRHSRDARDIRLVAVSKTRSQQEVREAIAAGQLDFGENTVQDALSKIPHIDADDVAWHFIGHLQSNKCKQVAGHFQWLHSADSLKLLRKLDHALAAADAAPMSCLLQVNIAGEASKSGLAVEDVAPLIDQTLEAGLDRIRLRGLMTIGVAGDEDATRKLFAECRELAGSLRRSHSLQHFDQLSMGMSGDYREAIAEGATMLRIGTAIFGPRSYPTAAG